MKRYTLLITRGILLLSIILIGCQKSVNNNNNNDSDNTDMNEPGIGTVFPSSLTFDHSCTDITKIPESWIQQAKELFRIHYGHTSHGEQIVTGLQRMSSESSSNSLLTSVKHRFSGQCRSSPQWRSLGS